MRSSRLRRRLLNRHEKEARHRQKCSAEYRRTPAEGVYTGPLRAHRGHIRSRSFLGNLGWVSHYRDRRLLLNTSPSETVTPQEPRESPSYRIRPTHERVIEILEHDLFKVQHVSLAGVSNFRLSRLGNRVYER